MARPRKKPQNERKRRKMQAEGLDKVIGKQIAYVRERVRVHPRPRVTQQGLAQMLGVTQATVVRIESGARAITVGELFQIAAALNCTPEDLLAGSFTEDDVPVTGEITLKPDEARGWLRGDFPLPGADEYAYNVVNIPRSRAKHVQARLSGNFKPSQALLEMLEREMKEADDAS